MESGFKWQDALTVVGVLLAVAGMGDMPLPLRASCFGLCAACFLIFIFSHDWPGVTKWLVAIAIIALMSFMIHHAIQSAAPKIAKTVRLEWHNPQPIAFGVPLTDEQLNASAWSGSTKIEGEYVYNPAAGSTLLIGTDTLSLTFTPTDVGFSPEIKTVTIKVVAPPPVSIPPTAKLIPKISEIKFLGVKAIEIDNNGAAILPVMFVGSGTGTLQFHVMSFTRAVSPPPTTPEAEIPIQEMFWNKFEAGENLHNSKLMMSVMPNVPGTAQINLGPEISNMMPTLKERGGVIYLAIRFKGSSGKIVEQTCMGVDPVTSYGHLCANHNIP